MYRSNQAGNSAQAAAAINMQAISASGLSQT
jgi:hypothetical protein